MYWNIFPKYSHCILLGTQILIRTLFAWFFFLFENGNILLNGCTEFITVVDSNKIRYLHKGMPLRRFETGELEQLVHWRRESLFQVELAMRLNVLQSVVKSNMESIFTDYWIPFNSPGTRRNRTYMVSRIINSFFSYRNSYICSNCKENVPHTHGWGQSSVYADMVGQDRT